MKYILGLAVLFGTIWPFMGNIMLNLKRNNIFELSNVVWHWVIPTSNFGTYFLLIFFIFKIMKIKTIKVKNKKLTVFNIGLIATSAIWFLGLIKIYIPTLERILYYLPTKNILIVSSLLLFLGILQFILEIKRETQNVK